jgi:hypothetical protein
MEKSHISIFASIEVFQKTLSYLIPVDSINIEFSISEEKQRRISLTVFYTLNNEKSNLTVTVYDFNSKLTFEELFLQAQSDINKINPTSTTFFSLS